MNIAITVTCLLIEAAEKSIELRIDNDRLRISKRTEIDPDLRTRLREHRASIVERLKHNVANPNPFQSFLDECCLFYTGHDMAISKAEMAQVYQQWAKDNNKTALSLVKLDKQLRRLGCEEIIFQSAPWWEHITVYNR